MLEISRSQSDALHLDEELRKTAALDNALSSPMSIVASVAVLLGAYGYVPLSHSLPLVISICALATARFVASVYLLKKSTSPIVEHIQYGLILLQGAVWGSIGFILSPDYDPFLMAFLTLTTAGVSIGAILLLLSTPRYWLSFIALVMVPHMIYLSLEGGQQATTLATSSAMFVIAVSILSIRLRTYMLNSLTFRHSLQEKHEEILDKNERLFQLAHYDGLTGVANRKLLISEANDIIGRRGEEQSMCAFFLIDLDHFKHLNDTMGHAAGDELLRIVAARLKNTVREHDIVARLGGDEFGIFVSHIAEPEIAEEIAKKLLKILNQPQRIQGALINTKASVGISFFPNHGVTITELMNNADLAMQAAKRGGRGHFAVCTNALQLDSMRRVTVEGELRRAIREQAIGFKFQPILTTQTGEITGVEALMRVDKSEGIEATAEDFVQVAASVGLSDEISEALTGALAVQGPELFRKLPELTRISINLSPIDLRSPKCVSRMKRVFHESSLTPQQVQIEITEQSVLERGADQARKAINQLADMGCPIVMDDFGTGYSSMTHLKTLPISGIKIDKSFVSELNNDTRDAAIVRSIIGMCRGLGLSVTAEGVEHMGQFETLRRLGCDYVQGYLFSQARSIDELVQVRAEQGQGPSLMPRNLLSGDDLDAALSLGTATGGTTTN